MRKCVLQYLCNCSKECTAELACSRQDLHALSEALLYVSPTCLRDIIQTAAATNLASLFHLHKYTREHHSLGMGGECRDNTHTPHHSFAPCHIEGILSCLVEQRTPIPAVEFPSPTTVVEHTAAGCTGLSNLCRCRYNAVIHTEHKQLHSRNNAALRSSYYPPP